MSMTRYTATIQTDAHMSIQCLDNNLNHLITHTLRILDAELGHVQGVIIDNRTGKIVHRCSRD